MTVFGKNFGTASADALVSFIPLSRSGQGNSGLSVVRIADSSVAFVVPANVGTDSTISVTVKSQTGSLQGAFNYSNPTIATFLPTTGSRPTSGGFVMTLTGTNFGTAATSHLVTVGVGNVICTSILVVVDRCIRLQHSRMRGLLC
jgi:hypothetical protein